VQSGNLFSLSNSDILLSNSCTLKIPITGCTITPNGKFIFADYGKKGLHILNEDWTTDNLDVELPAISFAYDVTCIDDKRLGISTGNDKQISIINIASKKTETIINTICNPFLP
jgi:formylmethanofuran dehydrogenase subunit E